MHNAPLLSNSGHRQQSNDMITLPHTHGFAHLVHRHRNSELPESVNDGSDRSLTPKVNCRSCPIKHDRLQSTERRTFTRVHLNLRKNGPAH